MSVLALLLSSFAFGAEIEVEGTVTAVTVYADRARVTREISVDVPSGRTELVFEGLSLGLIADSLAAEGEGTARAIITGIDLRTVHGTEERDERIRALAQEKLALEDRVAVQRDVMARAKSEITFVEGVQPTAPDKLTEATFLANDAPAQLAALSRDVGADLKRLYAESRAAERQIRDLQTEIARIQREMNQLSTGNVDAQRVAVGLDAGRPGRVTVRLSYVVVGASWTPRYDARYRLADGKVALDVSGVVKQSTGEDWKSVALTLSTARPQQETAPPTLQPFTLQQGHGAPGRGSGAAVSDRLTAFEFTAKQRETVSADGTSRRVYLASELLDGEDVHRVVARRQESAFLTSRMDWQGDFALLPGPVASYMGTAYVGEGRLGLVAPGSELVVSFGVDDRVSVKRTRVTDVEGGAKPLGNRERQRWAFKTEVTNRTGREISLLVLDQVPASSQAAYEVKPETTPAVAIPANGLFEWKDRVPNGETRTYGLAYEVSWPVGDRPVTME